MDEFENPHQIVICCDGTNSNLTGRVCDTNVVKLCELLARDDDRDRALYYDPGVGNPGSLPGTTLWDKLSRVSARVGGLAFGRGVYENIAEAYLFLMRHYRPGSQIFIFGFSRGAFTARSVAGLVNQFGLLRPQMESMLPTLVHTYFSDRQRDKAQIDRIAAQTSELFTAPALRQVEVRYVGVWDTVASVGMWPFAARFTARPIAAGKRFVHVRQALALDEQRAQFKPRPYIDDNGALTTAGGTPGSIAQLWFRGAHCDVGGGYRRDASGLSDTALCWLVSEAVQCGLRLSPRGITLDSEPAVARALLDLNPPPASVRRLHSALWDTCGWAVTGMAVRDTRQTRLDDGTRAPLQLPEHPSVATQQAGFPADTVWSQPRGKGWLVACCIALPLLLLMIGHLLTDDAPGRTALDLLQANVDFALWQLGAWAPGHLFDGLRFRASHYALVWDLALIGAYAYLLAWWAVRAFACRAGCRRVGQPVPRWLNVLGWALPLAVFADLGENAATAIVLTLVRHGYDTLAWLAAWPLAALAVAKFVGLAGTLALIASAWLGGSPKERPAARQPA